MNISNTKAPLLQTVAYDPLDPDLPLEPWQNLAETSLDPNPFFSPTFIRPFLSHMRHTRVRLVVVRDETTGDWMMAAPVLCQRLGMLLPAQALWTTYYSPLGTPLLHPSAGTQVIDSFLQAASGRSGVIAFPVLPLQSKTARKLRAAPNWNTKIASPATRAMHLSGPAGETQLAQAFTGKRRKEMRRLLRRLEDHGPVEKRHLSGPDVLEGFEAFLELEARGWKGRGGTALLNAAGTAGFSREMIKARSETSGVRIDQLWVGEKLAATLVLLTERDRIYSWKIAFDEEFSRYSPGAQIALMAMRENLAQPDFEEADSLAIPGHAMIEPLWRGRLETATLLMTKGPVAGLYQRLCALDLAGEATARTTARAAKRRLQSLLSRRA